MDDTIPVQNTLMSLLVRRCNLDAAAIEHLHKIEAMAWEFIADEPSTDLARHVFAVVGVVDSPADPTPLTTSARRLLRAHGRAREAGVPVDVLASFTDESLRMAVLLHDAFQRGYHLGRAEARGAGLSAPELAH